VNAADPLNLTGVVTPGRRVPALATRTVTYVDGVPVDRDDDGGGEEAGTTSARRR
jgi:ATP-dependent Lhr-like helicase